MGYIIGTWGNVAVRLTDGLLVTPTRMNYTTMTPDDLVVCNWDGEVLRGRRLPTSEMHLHRLILAARADLGALIHNHSPQAAALACAGVSLPCIAEDQAQILGGAVACSEYVVSSSHLPFAEEARRAFGNVAAAVLLANHGAIIGGVDLPEALAASAVLEKTAGMYLAAAAVGGAKTLPLDIVAEERHRYLFKYGSADDAK